jgi:membrane associated rhomboid family serine protease
MAQWKRMQTAGERMVVGRFRRARKAHEFGLVVLSQGGSYQVEPCEGGFVLWAEGLDEAHLREQVKLYTEERRRWRLVGAVVEHPSRLSAPVLWTALLFISYALSARYPDWYSIGTASSVAIFGDGEYWRAGTALLLHADLAHLAGNIGFGAIFLYWLSRQSGSMVALGATLVAGIIGNLLNALLYYPAQHLSVGASTAVFGTVGLLAGVAMRRGSGVASLSRWRAWLGPLLTGVVLLAWFGSGDGARTDVSAHLTGFISGIAIGLLLPTRRQCGEKPA